MRIEISGPNEMWGKCDIMAGSLERRPKILWLWVSHLNSWVALGTPLSFSFFVFIILAYLNSQGGCEDPLIFSYKKHLVTIKHELVNKYLLSICCVPGTVQGSGDYEQIQSMLNFHGGNVPRKQYESLKTNNRFECWYIEPMENSVLCSCNHQKL